MNRLTLARTAALLLAGIMVCAAWAGPDPAPGTPSKFSNRGSVANTRHNLTQRPNETGPGGPINAALMDTQRNNYGEVCVYCHTPHGANQTIAAPLWNRTTKLTTYQTYDLLATASITQPVSQPGASSLTCLSCHDGTTAVDAIVNMPGSGRYNIARISSDAPALLNEWPNAAVTHVGLQGPDQGCLVCHNPNGCGRSLPHRLRLQRLRAGHRPAQRPPGRRALSPTAGAGTDFNEPQRRETRLAYFDVNGNSRADANELRLYNTGDGYEVECASCHDPHGVASAGPGSNFNPTFLRRSNAGSGVCLSCHSK